MRIFSGIYSQVKRLSSLKVPYSQAKMAPDTGQMHHRLEAVFSLVCQHEFSLCASRLGFRGGTLFAVRSEKPNAPLDAVAVRLVI